MKINVYCDVQPAISVVQVGAIHPLQIWMHLLVYCEILKINMLICPLKNEQQPTTSLCSAVELPWLETTHFQKHLNMQNILCTVIEHRM